MRTATEKKVAKGRKTASARDARAGPKPQPVAVAPRIVKRGLARRSTAKVNSPTRSAWTAAVSAPAHRREQRHG